MQDFGAPKKNEERRFIYNPIKTITFFLIIINCIFRFTLRKYSLVFMEHEGHFIFLNYLGTSLEKKHFIKFNSLFFFTLCHILVPNFIQYHQNTQKSLKFAQKVC